MKSLYNSANDMSNTIKHITFGVGKDDSLRGFSPGKCHYLHTPEIRKEDNEMELCMHSRPSFASDYMEGAHPAILARLMETNMLKTQGYGSDPFSQSAREKIRAACGCPDAEIHFLVGGTQTNATVIRGLLHSYEGVIAAGSGHISVHEAGAIELGGHKVLTLPHVSGKLRAADIEGLIADYRKDANSGHMVMPGMVYISHPTEYGTLYSLSELQEISSVCRKNGLPLFLDGARLAYALSCSCNELSLKDIARLCDVFYIGGTKCGALFGEAVVITQQNLIPHFFTVIKQNGALLAKGRMLGIQFDTLFEDDLYMKIGASAIAAADQIRDTLTKCGYRLFLDSPTNQVFIVMENEAATQLARKAEITLWEKYDDSHTMVRFVTDWATQQRDVDMLVEILEQECNPTLACVS